MHKTDRPLNVPLALALLGGAMIVGGAILAYPDSKRAPTHGDAREPVSTKALPSRPDEQPSVTSAEAAPISSRPPLPAPTALGGGPSGSDSASVGDGGVLRAPPARLNAPEDEQDMERPAPRSSGDVGGAAVPAIGVQAPTTTTRRLTESTTAPSAAPVENAGAAPSGSASAMPSASAAPMGSASGMTDPNVPYVLPTFGAPGAGASTTTQPPIANTGGTSLGGGGGGGTSSGGGGSGGSTSTTSAAITAPMLLPLNDTASPQTWWPSVSTHLRSGDVVMARVTRDAMSSTFMSWSERARTDAPTAGYGVAFDRIPQLDAAITSGVPAALATLGLGRTDGVTDAALIGVATRVHAAGRKLFVSLDVPSRGPTYATVGARADIVELVIGSGTLDAAIAAAKDAAAKIGAKPVLYVRLPAGLVSAASAAQLTAAIPAAGVALPWSEDLSRLVTDYRP